MVSISLGFISRVKLIGILREIRGGEGGYEKLNAMLELYKAVRFSDQEVAQLEITESQGLQAYRLKDASAVSAFDKTIDIETQEAKWLLKDLDAWAMNNASIEDLDVWLGAFRKQLQLPPQ